MFIQEFKDRALRNLKTKNPKVKECKLEVVDFANCDITDIEGDGIKHIPSKYSRGTIFAMAFFNTNDVVYFQVMFDYDSWNASEYIESIKEVKPIGVTVYE